MCTNKNTHTSWPYTKKEKTPVGSHDMQPFTFPRRDNLPPSPSSPSPPVGEALMVALKGSTYIPNLQATWSSVIQLGEERESDEGVTKERESVSGRETCMTAEGKSCAAVAINKLWVERESRAQRLRLCPNSHSTASSLWPLSLFLTPLTTLQTNNVFLIHHKN